MWHSTCRSPLPLSVTQTACTYLPCIGTGACLISLANGPGCYVDRKSKMTLPSPPARKKPHKTQNPTPCQQLTVDKLNRASVVARGSKVIKVAVEIQCADKATFCLICFISANVARIKYFIGKKSPPLLYISRVLITSSLPVAMELCLFCY